MSSRLRGSINLRPALFVYTWGALASRVERARENLHILRPRAHPTDRIRQISLQARLRGEITGRGGLDRHTRRDQRLVMCEQHDTYLPPKNKGSSSKKLVL